MELATEFPGFTQLADWTQLTNGELESGLRPRLRAYVVEAAKRCGQTVAVFLEDLVAQPISIAQRLALRTAAHLQHLYNELDTEAKHYKDWSLDPNQTKLRTLLAYDDHLSVLEQHLTTEIHYGITLYYTE